MQPKAPSGQRNITPNGGTVTSWYSVDAATMPLMGFLRMFTSGKTSKA
jgi:hypothetical protein